MVFQMNHAKVSLLVSLSATQRIRCVFQHGQTMIGMMVVNDERINLG
jgi:hypothetical protein